MTFPAAVLFDLDDTLLVDLACIAATIRSVCELAAEATPGLDPEGLDGAVRRHAKAAKADSPYFDFCDAVGIASWELLAADFTADAPLHDALRTWTSVIRVQVWGRALREMGVDDGGLALELAAAYAARRRTAYELFADALPCVDALAGAGVAMAIVTNGPADLQHEKVRHTELASRFAPEVVIVSGELGVGKPDPLPLRLACDRLGVAVADAVMVGDSRRRDIAAADAAGMRSVLVDRAGTHPRAIPGLDELPAHLTAV